MPPSKSDGNLRPRQLGAWRGLIALLADIRPLRESPAFRRVWLGSTLSALGGQMTAVALPIQVYGLTRSSFAVGLTGLFLAAPLITVGLVGAHVVDRVDRRRLVLLTTGLLSLVSLALAAQASLDVRQLWLLYALAAIQSAISAIDGPAKRTFGPRLLPAERLSAANALSFLSFQVSLVLGPLIAGAIIAGSGLPAAYGIDAASFLASLYAVLRLPPMLPEGRQAGARGLHAAVEGVRFVLHRPVIATAFLVDLNATIFGMPFALFPAIAQTHFGGGPQAVGLLYAAPGMGGIVSSTFSGPLTRLRRQGRAVMIAVFAWGVAIAAFGISPWLPLAVFCLAVAGAADVVNGVFRTTIQQIETPDAVQGRVSSIGQVVGIGGPRLGDLEAGAVAALTSPTFSATSGGLACAAGVITIRFMFPGFWRYVALQHRREAR